MTDQPDRNPAAPATVAGFPATRTDAAPPVALDINGFNPNDFEWRPVPRRARSDGWTPEVQQRFIEALARTGIVEHACEEVGMSVRSAYNLRNAPQGKGFARAWAAVLASAADRLLDVAFEHAIMGEEVPIFDQDGVRTGAKRRYNTRMAMFLLRAYHPERFRHAGKDTRQPGESPPPAAAPVPAIVASLAPVTPAEPHLLSAPDRLDEMLETAEVLAGPGERVDEPEPYRLPRQEEQHERVFHRARFRRARRSRLEDEARHREGFDE